jgi:hypothetical protein
MASVAKYAPYFRVQLVRSTAPDYLDRNEFNNNAVQGRLLTDLFLDVLRAVVTSNHLIAPLHAMEAPEYSEPGDFETVGDRQAYYRDHRDILTKIGVDLARRFARTPITALVVDTSENRWAAVSYDVGFEHTIFLEKRLIDVIMQNTPEARLFGFLVFYHEITNLFRGWVGAVLSYFSLHCISYFSVCVATHYHTIPTQESHPTGLRLYNPRKGNIGSVR